MKQYKLSVVVEKDADGYIAFCPELEGCYTQGETYEVLMENIRDAIQLHIQDKLAMGEEIETYDMVSLTSLEVTV